MTDQTNDASLLNKCPHCGTSVRADTFQVGEMVTCPNPDCRGVFRIAVPAGEPVHEDEERNQKVGEDDEGSSSSSLPVSPETTVLRIHPAFIRRRPFKALLAAAAGLCGVAAIVFWGAMALGATQFEVPGGIPGWGLLVAGAVLLGGALFAFLAWWVAAKFVTLTVTNKRSILKEGLISRETSEVQHDDVRNLQLDQNVVQRLLGIGDIAISSAGQADMEIEATGMPDPDRVAQSIRQKQR